MNKTISRYLDKNILFPVLIKNNPSSALGIIVVIPCYNELDVNSSIEAIADCDPPNCQVEVIVSINAGEDSPSAVKAQNAKTVEDLTALSSKLPQWLNLYTILHNDLPKKKAGVGLGRKIGMDEAVRRFLSIDKQEGVIVCFDADSKCDRNYLVEIESHFSRSGFSSASIHYEHPIEGTQFPEEIYASIIQYELHLRYFIRMQKRIRLPFAFHTVGSSMACTVSAYCAVGGMNQRKAGEDFYFIHKLVKYGKHSELNSTKVIPSPRVSDRVPFGTGRAVGEMQEKAEVTYFTYHPQSFLDLKILVDQLQEVYKNKGLSKDLPDGLAQFLESVNFKKEVHRILHNTSDYPSFYKMFWHWFDAFLLMKYLHFVRDRERMDIPVLDAVNTVESITFTSSREALIYYRKHDLLEN